MIEHTIRSDLVSIFGTAIHAVNGTTVVSDYLSQHQPQLKKVAIIAVGKAAEAMTFGVVTTLGDCIQCGIVITKSGHLSNILDDRFICLESSHPIPDQESLDAGQQLITFCKRISTDTSVIVCISGGASSLVENLRPGICLEQLQQLNKESLAAGINIQRINDKRKAISIIKAGGLALLLEGHSVLGLYISDVQGDNPATIGSGLLVTNDCNNDTNIENIKHVIVANLEMAKIAAAKQAEKLGYQTLVHHQFFDREAEDLAREFVNETHSEREIIHIWGGESVVRLPHNPGMGGRNLHLALAAAIQMPVGSQITLLAAGTDGNDGVTDVAGAIVDSGTIARAIASGLDPDDYLKKANSYQLLELTGDLVDTGPTNTNVMDLVLAYSKID